jgi:hypothetical protein
MNRSGLIARFKELSELSGYSFAYGFLYRINEYPGTYPLVWLCPFDLVKRKKSGNAKNITFKVTMYLLVQSDDFTEYEKVSNWDKMENDAQVIFDSLFTATNDIQGFDDFTSEVDEFAVSNRGSISVKITANVIIYDCE